MSELTQAASCLRYRKRIDEGQDRIIVLVVSFVLDGRIDGRVFWLCLSFIQSTEVGGQMGLFMKAGLIGVVDDRMIEMVLLFIYRLRFG